MEKRIDRILKDLYRIDPALREREEEMKKAIREMLDARPGAKPDPRFERELKASLLARFSEKEKRNGIRALVTRSWFRAAVGLAAAACIAIALIPRTNHGTKVARGEPFAATTESGYDDATSGNRDRIIAPSDSLGPVPPRQNQAASSPAASGEAAVARSAPSQDRIAEEGVFFAEAEERGKAAAGAGTELPVPIQAGGRGSNTEGYDHIVENRFYETLKEPLSTFSIDVDTASYANVRRFIETGSLPPPDAVRIEELVNYFPYAYAEPSGEDPLAYDTELAACPWNKDHCLLRLGLQARRVAEKDLPPTNLVFLIDVSGSMEDQNKLPLVKESLKLLAARMRQQDRISIVVYAGNAGQVLPPTSGDRKDLILEAIDRLEAGGSTAGGEGIILAYGAARKAFITKGNNRVVLATDGDFNVGASSDGELVRIIEEKRKSGIFLTVLGFGMGNYKDSKMQKLADSGNGNYAYVDSLKEARKVLEKQMAGTLFTLAKDVKIQIEFNPATVASYRLIGYEKRILAAQDFDDDTKDAGELGAGHSVTALYELVPAPKASAGGTGPGRTDLKYQSTTMSPAAGSGDLMTIKFRYKKPDGDTSKLLETAVPWKPVQGKPSEDFRFAAAVAEWGLLLLDSEFKGSATHAQVEDLAMGALAQDRDVDGYRAGFLSLVKKSRALAER
ncbi:MAG: VWA domain-containing protein [Spirochaetes bacterium]|nr:VWA domain-containing protein [Spirochaetota bacterium]